MFSWPNKLFEYFRNSRTVHTQQSLVFTQNGVKKKTAPVSGSSAGRNTMLMREVRGEQPGRFELAESS